MLRIRASQWVWGQNIGLSILKQDKICANILLSHWCSTFPCETLSAKATFTLSAQKVSDYDFQSQKGKQGSELESPLVLKAQGQGIKPTGNLQNAKPTQL